MSNCSNHLTQRNNDVRQRRTSKSTNAGYSVAEKLKDSPHNAAELLKKELLELRVYDKTNPQGGRLKDWVKNLPFMGGTIHISPLRIPIQRRIQTLVVAWHTSSFVYFFAFTLLILANPFLWWFMLPYMVYYAFDRSPANGSVVKRYSPWFRSLSLWRYYCEYYPISLHKEVDLEPTFTTMNTKEGNDVYAEYSLRLWPLPTNVRINIRRAPSPQKIATGPRYIFGYHPHGIAALGAFGAIATEGCNWSGMFPGIPTCLCTLVNQFQIPIYRDYLLAFGCTSVSRKNVMKVLEQNYSVGIVIGGASEALLSKVGSADLVLQKRKGFVKLALETGNVNLVPVYAFGETDCFNILDTGEETYLRRFQLWVKRTYGFTLPFFFARGIFNYDFGFIPFRNPINVVVGRPIYVGAKRNNPTMEEINYYHSLYVSELKRLFDEHKEQFGYKNSSLNCVE